MLELMIWQGQLRILGSLEVAGKPANFVLWLFSPEGKRKDPG